MNKKEVIKQLKETYAQRKDKTGFSVRYVYQIFHHSGHPITLSKARLIHKNIKGLAK